MSCAVASVILARILLSSDLHESVLSFQSLVRSCFGFAVHLRSAQGISNKEVFAFDILEFNVIFHDSTKHSLESNRVILNRLFQGVCGAYRLSLPYHKCRYEI